MRRPLGKPRTLRRRREFLRVQGGGKRFKGRHVLLFVAGNEEDTPRVGFTVSRKVGNAVVRNRVRRRLREIIRLNQEALIAGTDHIVIAFSNAPQAPWATLQDELSWLLKRARDWASAKSSPSR